jgi:hypothetical protein
MIPEDTNQALKFDAAIPISSTLADVDVSYIVAFLDRMNVGRRCSANAR